MFRNIKTLEFYMPPKKLIEEKKSPFLGRIGTNLKVEFFSIYKKKILDGNSWSS